MTLGTLFAILGDENRTARDPEIATHPRRARLRHGHDEAFFFIGPVVLVAGRDLAPSSWLPPLAN